MSSSPVHFSIVSKGSKSMLLQPQQKRKPRTTKEGDRQCWAPCQRCSRSRGWSFCLRIPRRFESRLLSLVYSSWFLQDPSSWGWIEASVLNISNKGLRNGMVCFQPFYINPFYVPDFRFTSYGRGKCEASTNSWIERRQGWHPRIQLLLWRLHTWQSAIGCMKFALPLLALLKSF